MVADAIRTGRLLSKNTRPQNVVYPGLLAASVAYTQGAPLAQCVVCYLLILCIYAVAASVNNIADIRTDRLNRRTDNPLATRLLRPQELTPFILIALCGIIVLQVYLAQPYSIGIVVAYVVLLYMYSTTRYNLQSRGLWGSTALCICYSALPVLLGVYQKPTGIHGRLFPVVAWALLATLPIILAKDYKDYTGDKRTGKLTPLVRFGAVKLRKITYAVLALSSIAYLVLTWTHRAEHLWLAAVSVTAYALLTIVLHRKSGALPKLYKTALLFLLIAMVNLLLR